MRIVWYTKKEGKVFVENNWVGNCVKDNNGLIHLDNVNGVIIK